MEGPADVSEHVGKLENRDIPVIREKQGVAAPLDLFTPAPQLVKQLQDLD